MKIGCLLSVREKATRLPHKALLDVGGKPLTARLLERLTMCKGIDKLILATSSHPDDDILEALANSGGIATFRGHPEDKLNRYFHTAKSYGLDAVIIVDGDDLFCFPECVDMVAAELRKGEFDCIYLSGLPLGAASTGLTTNALEKVLDLKDEEDTEVWGGYFIGSNYFSSKEIHLTDPMLAHPNIRLTIDYPEDYDFACRIVFELNNENNFSSFDLMELLVHKKPELCNINKSATVLYEDHIKKSAPVKFKHQNIFQ